MLREAKRKPESASGKISGQALHGTGRTSSPLLPSGPGGVHAPAHAWRLAAGTVGAAPGLFNRNLSQTRVRGEPRAAGAGSTRRGGQRHRDTRAGSSRQAHRRLGGAARIGIEGHVNRADEVLAGDERGIGVGVVRAPHDPTLAVPRASLRCAIISPNRLR